MLQAHVAQANNHAGGGLWPVNRGPLADCFSALVLVHDLHGAEADCMQACCQVLPGEARAHATAHWHGYIICMEQKPIACTVVGKWLHADRVGLFEVAGCYYTIPIGDMDGWYFLCGLRHTRLAE